MKKLIGKGMFSKAYQVGENEVELHSFCMSKECYAMFSQENKFAPVIELIDRKDDGAGIYKMPLYPKIKAPKKQLNAHAYKLYRQLQNVQNKYLDNYFKEGSYKFFGYNEFCEAVESSDIESDDKEEIISLASDVCNGIDIRNLRFEISPRNISANPDGSLVMLDCFFDISKIY